MHLLEYDWQRLWTISFWNGFTKVHEVQYVGGVKFTPHSLHYILRAFAHELPPYVITNVTLSCTNDLGDENDLTTTG